jgi:hypothetical protein
MYRKRIISIDILFSFCFLLPFIIFQTAANAQELLLDNQMMYLSGVQNLTKVRLTNNSTLIVQDSLILNLSDSLVVDATSKITADGVGANPLGTGVSSNNGGGGGGYGGQGGNGYAGGNGGVVFGDDRNIQAG